jgi:membrane associated rhomboid family serine protease/Zn-finger nucleic acid-binding protein
MIKPQCPRCSTSLSREKTRGALYYHCKSCLGFCFTLSALKRFVDQSIISELWEGSENLPVNEGAHCPHCMKGMKTLLDHDKGIPEIDICRRCYSVWLDHGEIDHLPLKEHKEVLSPEGRKAVLEFELNSLKEKDESLISGKGSHFSERISPPSGLKFLLSLVGLPVEKHDDVFLTQPILTWLLILICFLVGYLGHGNREMIELLGFFPAKEGGPFLLGLFSSFFVHANWLHLAGNMYFLWVFGDNVEDDLGKVGYIFLIFIATGVGASAYYLYNGESNIPVVGASGGIYGVMAYYLVKFPYRKFVVMFFYRWFMLPAWGLFGFYLFKDIIGLFLAQNSGVAHVSHLAGALVGFLLGMLSLSRKH